MVELAHPSRPSVLKILFRDVITCSCLLPAFGMGIVASIYKIPLFLVVIVPLIAITSLRTIQLLSLHKRAVIVQGRVTRFQLGIRGFSDIAYTYSYEGNSYEGRNSSGIKLTVGNSVAIAVDPYDPSKSDLLDRYF